MDLIKAMAEPTRRAIVRLVWSDEMSAGEIAGHFDVTFGAVSQHLGVLRHAGLVGVRRDGNRRYYRARRDRFGPMGSVLESMWTAKLDQLVAAIEDDHDH